MLLDEHLMRLTIFQRIFIEKGIPLKMKSEASRLTYFELFAIKVRKRVEVCTPRIEKIILCST